VTKSFVRDSQVDPSVLQTDGRRFLHLVPLFGVADLHYFQKTKLMSQAAEYVANRPHTGQGERIKPDSEQTAEERIKIFCISPLFKAFLLGARAL
jgi:hypothetical protein